MLNMKNAVLLVCAFLSVAHGRTIDANAIYKPRVINGEEAQLGEIPYQVALLDRGVQFCGGSIVNEYWIVTAAHCVKEKVTLDVQVSAGSVSLLEPYSTHQVVRIIAHEGYESFGTLRNDIALVKIDTPLTFTFGIEKAILPQPHAQVQANSPMVVSGWGFTSDGTVPTILQKTTVYITDPEVCQAIMQKEGYTTYPTQICANDPTQRRGECNGDSGGPVTSGGILTGIVSWSLKSDGGCGSPRLPGIHTRVSEYVDWINEHIK